MGIATAKKSVVYLLRIFFGCPRRERCKWLCGLPSG